MSGLAASVKEDEKTTAQASQADEESQTGPALSEGQEDMDIDQGSLTPTADGKVGDQAQQTTGQEAETASVDHEQEAEQEAERREQERIELEEQDALRLDELIDDMRDNLKQR